MKAAALFVVALCLCQFANADEAARKAKVSQIIEAQGLLQMFDQQLEQSKIAAIDMGKGLYKKLLADGGIPEGKKRQQAEEILNRYAAKCATMFSAKELVDSWTSFYGKNLTDADLDAILAYYKSPAGKKDVASSQTAMAAFSKSISAEGQKRMSSAASQLMSELKATLK